VEKKELLEIEAREREQAEKWQAVCLAYAGE